jgi:hypothetical protein
MKQSPILLLFISTLISPMNSIFCVEIAQEKSIQSATKNKQKVFESFTGKVTRNKVRLRLQPNTDAYVLRELNQNDLLVITGETDDFYTVQPAKDIKGYIFRTFVLDNIVEGNRVNVRLKPDTESPIITQMNSGDRVNGSIDTTNPKWLEISLPMTTNFYVSKDFIEKVGDANMVSRMEKRREDSNQLLNTTYTVSQNEINKSFNQINIESSIANYKKIINEYNDIPEVASRANTLLSELQNTYTAKKIAYLESQTHQNNQELESRNKTLTEKLEAYQRKLFEMETQVNKKNNSITVAATTFNRIPSNMSIWIPVEEVIIEKWLNENAGKDTNNFYEEQESSAQSFRGLIEPYNRPVKNRPGDYLLVNPQSKLPIAFLYSTNVNIQDFVGHEVVIKASPRPNNNYAFPAYFVLTIE